ncbi:MAG: hemoglobin [Jatrophihabitantaceae bacterium]|nr:hemoglobin [Jatrophihabitantaceae bacterium]
MTETTAAPLPEQPRARQSLFTAIGGADAVAAVVDALYVRLLADPQTARFFHNMDMARLNSHMRVFLTGALGGGAARGASHVGRDLGEAHAHLNITTDDFDRVAAHVGGVLQDLGVEVDMAEAVLALIRPLRSVIARPLATTAG